MRLPSHASTAFAILLTAACGAQDPETLKREYVASGDRYVAQQKYAEGIVQYRNAVAQDPRFGEARSKLASAYEKTGDLQNAYREYVRAADLLPTDAAVQLQAGKMLHASGQFPEARARAEAALTQDPKNVNAMILLANALAGLKDIDSAISHLESAIDVAPRTAFAYANLGWFEVSRGNATAAQNVLKRAIEVDPKSMAARLNLANFYWATRRLEDAERELKEAIAINPRSTEANRVMAAFYVTNGKRAEAEPFVKAFAESTDRADAKLTLADFYLNERRTKDAVAVLEGLRNHKDAATPAALRLAALDFEAGRRPEAYAAVEKILQQEPNGELTLHTKAGFLVAEQKYGDALKVADAIVQRNPKALKTLYLRGVILRGLGRTEDAIVATRSVLEIDPTSIVAQGFLAELYLAQENGGAAVEFSQQVVKAQPQSPAAHFLHARALLLSGNVAAAEGEFTALARIDPPSADVQTWLGRTFLAKNDFGRARAAFTRALQLTPESLQALNGLVTLDVVEQRPAAARAKLDAELAKRPRDPHLLFMSGNVHMTLGDLAKAEPLFLEVLKIDPTHLDAYQRLGQLYVSQGRLEDAKSKFREATKQQQNPVTATTLVGIILEMQNRRDEARKEYDRALAMDPRAAVAANNLAWIYAEGGENLDLALQLAQTAKSVLPTHPNVSNTLGWVYYKKGLTTQAITALQESVDHAPNDAVKRYHLGLALLRNKQHGEARQALQRALTLNPSFAHAQDAKRILAEIQG